MATIIEQEPLYSQLPVGQDVVFTVSNNTIVATETKVKFIAEVHITNTFPTFTSSTLVGTFKTTPNNAGVGIFNFRNIVENYVSADNMARNGSEYKGVTTTADAPHPLHLIDKYSGNINAMRYMAIQFKIEYLGADAAYPDVVNIDTGQSAQLSSSYSLFNGYLKYSDKINLSNSDFGYDLTSYNLSSTSDSFLTNAPVDLYSNLEDYGTLAFLSPNDNLSFIRLTYKNSSGSTIGTEDINRTTANGAYTIYNDYIGMSLIYFGCYPANLQNWSSTFQALVTAGTIQGGSIQIVAWNNSGGRISNQYTINLNCPDIKGFESIRLTWLNQWGAWDYYTFTKKSTRSISTKGTTYRQLEGTWNESTYRLNSYKGGKKSFRVNATEKIKMNTNFVSEDNNTMFDELINSPEVYMLEGYQTDVSSAALNQYVTPVRLTTSSFTKKTVANDRLIQYTVEVEKSKTLRTQSI